MEITRHLRSPTVVAAWCAAYAVAHLWWAVVGDPAFFGRGESPLPGGWLPVVLSAAGGIGCLGLSAAIPRSREYPWYRWVLIGLAGSGGAGLVAYCMLFWISLTMLLMVPFGMAMSGGEAGLLLVRGAGVLGGGLALSAARTEMRRLRAVCLKCGERHRGPGSRTRSTPPWAFVGAYVAVAGLAVRLLTEAAGTLELWHAGNLGFKVFVVLLMLAGTVLPLALVHRWARIWPPWVVPLAGRTVPRWLVLGPGLFVGTGLVAYFGIGGIGAMLTGTQPAGIEVSLMIGGYAVWGIGLLVAATSYARLTRPPCPVEPGNALRVGASRRDVGTPPTSRDEA